MEKRRYYFDLSLVIILTLLMFAALTIPHLQHGVAFIFPVPLAVFIIRYEIKDGIIPALILILVAPFITHFLPIGGGSWIRGLLMMTTAVTIGFLHGAFTHTKMSHLKEILIVMAAELFFGILMTLVFYFIQDPIFAFNIEFPHYFERFRILFNLHENTTYVQNAGVIFQNSVIPYVIALAVTEVLLTHILIHLVLKYVYEMTDERPFTGLNFRLPKVFAYAYLVGLGLAIVSLFFLGQTLHPNILTAIVVLFIVVLSVMILFIFQGLMYLVYVAELKRNRELSLLFFVVTLILSVPSSILGALNVIFGWTDKMAIKTEHKEH